MVARSNDRIEPLLNEVKKAMIGKDIRLGQLLFNISYPMDVFNIEDDELLKRLEVFNKPSLRMGQRVYGGDSIGWMDATEMK